VSGAPSFDAIPAQTVLEGSAPQVLEITGISTSPARGDSSVVTLTATSDYPAIVPNPTISGTGGVRSLTYAPAPEAFGVVTINVTARMDGFGPFTRAFLVTVLSVNDPPTFDAIPDQSVTDVAGLQNVILTGVFPGPWNEADQSVTLTARSSDPAVVPDPVVTGTGWMRSLFYAPVPNASGNVTVTVTAVDNGGTANGGVDTFTRTFTISVTPIPVNVAPSFDPIADASALEDAGEQTIAVTGVSPGPPSESAQAVTLSARSSDPTIVPDPTISGAGAQRSLVFAPAANANGIVTVTLTAGVDGG
jgi:hypothetical protein